MGAAPFEFTPLLPLGPDTTPWRPVPIGDDAGGIEVVAGPRGAGGDFLRIAPGVLTALCSEAFLDISHLLRPAHLEALARIPADPEATENDRFVAHSLLKNAVIAAAGVFPMCQDTGTAIIVGKKGERVLTGGARSDEAALSRGVYDTWQRANLRFSQLAPLSMYDEANTRTNLPAQIELHAADGDEYRFLFMAKGGGSANKAYLFQETKALLNPASLMAFLEAKMRALGTAACPPYHLAIVVGGTSAEHTLKTAKLASAHELDALPTEGGRAGHGFRDLALEAELLARSRDLGIGAQFGGVAFCHDVRVVRLPRHGASCPVAVALSCSADRQARAKITRDGVFLEALERDPARFMPPVTDETLRQGGGAEAVVALDLSRPMSELRAELSRHPIRTRLSLTGPMVVARDIAHARIKERLDAGEPMPAYLRDHIVYYAGPARTPDGFASGSFGPTTAARMDPYMGPFMARGGSYVTLAKGNRSRQVTQACQEHGGFYLGSMGGPAAVLGRDHITKVEVLDYADLGMEAVWRIEVKDFPAFIVVDDKGHDFFAELT